MIDQEKGINAIQAIAFLTGNIREGGSEMMWWWPLVSGWQRLTIQTGAKGKRLWDGFSRNKEEVIKKYDKDNLWNTENKQYLWL